MRAPHAARASVFGIEHPILNAPMGGGMSYGGARRRRVRGGWARHDRRHVDGRRRRGCATRSNVRTTSPIGPSASGSSATFPAPRNSWTWRSKRGVRIVAHSFADPAPFMAAARTRGRHGALPGSDRRRRAPAVDAGVDVIVAQGTEAGGHTGDVCATLPLVPAVVDAVAPIPVIAAGGIADGRGIAAALMLGADGVWMGTRFVASPEAGSSDDYRARVVDAGADSSVLDRDVRSCDRYAVARGGRRPSDSECVHRSLARPRGGLARTAIARGDGPIASERSRRAAVVGGPGVGVRRAR